MTEVEFISAKDAAKLVNVSVSTINDWKNKGWLSPAKIDRKESGRRAILFRVIDVLRVATRREQLIREYENKPPVRLDEKTHARLLKVVGQAAIEGTRLTMRHIIIGALEQLTDEELLAAARRQVLQN